MWEWRLAVVPSLRLGLPVDLGAGLLTMVRHRAVIRGRAAGLLAFVGLVNLSGMLLVYWFAIALGQSGLPIDDAVRILERSATPVNMAA